MSVLPGCFACPAFSRCALRFLDSKGDLAERHTAEERAKFDANVIGIREQGGALNAQLDGVKHQMLSNLAVLYFDQLVTPMPLCNASCQLRLMA